MTCYYNILMLLLMFSPALTPEPTLEPPAIMPELPKRKLIHELFQWKAEEYFEDAKVIALCKAIEKNDLAEMERLIKDGADVNAQGKGKMTPLLWAYGDSELKRFELLLKHGADPNVRFESRFNTRDFLFPGMTITHMCCRTDFPGYFEAVFAHSGDVNLPYQTDPPLMDKSTPLHLIIREGVLDRKAKLQQIEFLVKQGADVNKYCSDSFTPLLLSVASAQRFHLTLKLLELGADHRLSRNGAPGESLRLIHYMVLNSPEEGWSKEYRNTYDAIVAKLEAKGESLKDARAYLKARRPAGTIK